MVRSVGTVRVPLQHQTAIGGDWLDLALAAVWLLPWTQLARGEGYVRLFGLGPLGQHVAAHRLPVRAGG